MIATNRYLDTLERSGIRRFTNLANAYPDVTFYFFYPPYSIILWNNYYRTGLLGQMLEAYEMASHMMLECENIRLYSFWSEYEIISDLNNYTDLEHHNSQINSKILQDMRTGKNQLTKENQQTYWKELYHFYSTFDYISLLESYGYSVG